MSKIKNRLLAKVMISLLLHISPATAKTTPPVIHASRDPAVYSTQTTIEWCAQDWHDLWFDPVQTNWPDHLHTLQIHGCLRTKW